MGAILERNLHVVIAGADSEGSRQGWYPGRGAKFPGSTERAQKEKTMGGQPLSTAPSDFRCPVCGAMNARKAVTSRNRSSVCPRCHTVLEVTTSRSSQSLTFLAASIVIALSLSIGMGLQAPRFAMVMGAAVALNWLGQSIRNLVVVPELKVRPNAHDKGFPENVRSAHRADPTPKATRRRESLKCPLVVTRE